MYHLQEPGISVFISFMALMVGFVLYDWLRSWRAEQYYHKGGEPERCGMGVIFYVLIVQVLGHFGWATHGSVYEINAVFVLADAIGLVGFVAIAFNARRIWPFFAALLYGLAIIWHFVRWAELDLFPLGYADLFGNPTALVPLLIFLGVVSRRDRLANKGWSLDWVTGVGDQVFQQTKTSSYPRLYRHARSYRTIGLPFLVWGAFISAYCAFITFLPGRPTTIFPLGFLGSVTFVGGWWIYERETSDPRRRYQWFC